MKTIIALACTILAAGVLRAQIPIHSWISASDDYAPVYSNLHKRWYITRTTSQHTAVLATTDLSVPPENVSITTNLSASSLGCLTISNDGEAYAVTYLLGQRQVYASVVRVFLSDTAIVVDKPVESLTGQWYTSFPAISPDARRMVVVSDREGGLGGTDLWVVEKMVDGSWSEPQHGGASINSNGNETTPQFVSVDTLLFSSDGFGGAGGYDVFRTVFANGRWSDPVPIEAVNGPLDETDAVLAPDRRLLFCRPAKQDRTDIDIWQVETSEWE